MTLPKCAYCDEPGVTFDGSLIHTCQKHRSDRYDPTEYLRGLAVAGSPLREEEESVYDMRRSALAIRDYTRGVTKIRFCRDQMTQDAVIHHLVLVGVAAARLSESWRMAHASVPWRQLTEFAQTALHRYWMVSPDLAWEIAQKDILAVLVATSPHGATPRRKEST
jgi:uncharacterized protein with HEPN domain